MAPKALALWQEKILWKTCLMAGQGQRGRKLVMSRKQRDHPNVQKHGSFKSGCSSYARVIQTPESAHRETLDLYNSESGISWDRGRRHHSFTGTHWCEPQWNRVWGTVLEQTGLNQAACSNISSYSLISSVFNLFCQLINSVSAGICRVEVGKDHDCRIPDCLSWGPGTFHHSGVNSRDSGREILE